MKWRGLFSLGQLAQADVPVTVFVRAPDEQTRFVSELRGHDVDGLEVVSRRPRDSQGGCNV